MPKLLDILKTWTLPIAMTMGTALYLIFAFTPALSDAATAMAPVFEVLMPMLLFAVLFFTFCKVDFHKMRPASWHWRVNAVQLLLVAVTVVTMRLLDLRGDNLILAQCALMCVIAPCAAAAAVVTAKLGGNVTSMTTVTFASNFLAAAVIPAVFPLVDSSFDVPFIEAFLAVMWRVCQILLLPMVAAYIVKHYMHRLHALIMSVPDLSFYTWGVSLSVVTGTTVRNIVHAHTTATFILIIAALSLAVCLVQFAIGKMLGKSKGVSIETGQALGQKNTAFAIWISHVYLNPLAPVGPGCYILWQNAVNSFELWRHEKRKS